MKKEQEQKYYDLEDIEDCTERTKAQLKEDNKTNPKIYDIATKTSIPKYCETLFPFIMITEEEFNYIQCMVFDDIKKSILSQIENIDGY